MKILCIDTSSNLCSVAILQNTKLEKKIELNNGLTHSETLMPTIQELLNSCNLTLKDIDLLVCDIGPGSFTGLRIGISTVKAFSDSLNIPCIGVTSLETYAYSINQDGLICSTIDCKNNNCYFCLFERKSSIYSIVEEPNATSVDDVLSLLKNKYYNKTIHFVGNCINCNDFIDIENLGIVGYNKFIKNNKLGEDILPLYLKKPQAEIQLEKKTKTKI